MPRDDSYRVSVGDRNRLLSALLMELPASGEWSGQRRENWLTALTAIIDLVIDLEPSSDAPAAESAR